MKLYTNKINTAKGKSFDDFVADFKKAKNIKTASTKMAEQEEADSSGQLDVEPLHQTGESTTMPKAGPSAKKDDGEKSSAKVKTSEDDEAPDSGAGTGEAKLNNDPKAPAKEEKAGSAKVSKIAETDEDEECGCGKDDCKKCTATMAAAIKTAGEKGMCNCGKPNFICRGKCKGGDGDGDDDGSTKEKEKEAASVKFVKIANLDKKNKGFLREFWKQLFDEDYVNAIIADK